MNKKLAGEIAAGLNDANLPPVTNKQVEPFAPPPPIHRPCGCDSCDRLAEAYQAMQEKLAERTEAACYALCGKTATKHSQFCHEARAALELARRVADGRD